LGRQLFQKLERRVTSEVNDALDRNTESQYLRTFNVDVQIQIQKVADGTKVVNLERRSFKMPESTAITAADMEKTAVTEAVREALKATLEKYPL
jgi:Trk K+ transport system NAD-binding subunit